MHKPSIIAALAAGVTAGAAHAAIIVTSVSGFAHVDGYTTALGFDRDEFNLTQTVGAFGESASVSESAAAGPSMSTASASLDTLPVAGGGSERSPAPSPRGISALAARTPSPPAARTSRCGSW